MDAQNPEECRSEGTTTERKAPRGGKKARSMVLRWALLRALGPDRWHFASILDSHRSDAYKDAIRRAARAVSAKGGQDVSLADVGANSGLMALIGASVGGIKVTRYEKLRPLALLEGKIAKANNLQGIFVDVDPPPVLHASHMPCKETVSFFSFHCFRGFICSRGYSNHMERGFCELIGSPFDHTQHASSIADTHTHTHVHIHNMPGFACRWHRPRESLEKRLGDNLAKFSRRDMCAYGSLHFFLSGALLFYGGKY